MITVRTIVDYMTAEPFRPFRIKMASGQEFEIRHPEMIRLGRANVRLYRPTETHGHESFQDISMLLMETVEPIDPPKKHRNGKAKR
jgi:hypothetical protein